MMSCYSKRCLLIDHCYFKYRILNDFNKRIQAFYSAYVHMQVVRLMFSSNHTDFVLMSRKKLLPNMKCAHSSSRMFFFKRTA